jgi:hypothetical protein
VAGEVRAAVLARCGREVTLSAVGSHSRVLSREVTCSDLYLQWLSLQRDKCKIRKPREGDCCAPGIRRWNQDQNRKGRPSNSWYILKAELRESGSGLEEPEIYRD